MLRTVMGTLLIALAVVPAACGDDGGSSSGGARVVSVSMTENEFTPNSFQVEKGETVTFRFHNDGRVVHEGVLGAEEEQAGHDMGHGASADAVTVEPGRTGTLTHTFDESGEVELGCHEPGHYESGMKGTIFVG